MQATPDLVVEYRPTDCSRCRAPLDVDALVLMRGQRQLQGLPSLRLVVIEHQAVHLRYPACQRVSVGVFPAQAPSRAQCGPQVRAMAIYMAEEQLVPLGRAQQLLSNLLAVQVGRGSLVAWVQQAAAVLVQVEKQIKAAQRQTTRRHVVETGMRRGGHLARAHGVSTSQLMLNDN